MRRIACQPANTPPQPPAPECPRSGVCPRHPLWRTHFCVPRRHSCRRPPKEVGNIQLVLYCNKSGSYTAVHGGTDFNCLSPICSRRLRLRKVGRRHALPLRTLEIKLPLRKLPPSPPPASARAWAGNRFLHRPIINGSSNTNGGRRDIDVHMSAMRVTRQSASVAQSR
jgi:hypothetical protein